MKDNQARRLGERAELTAQAKIIDQSECITDVVIRDMSATGARLEIPAHSALPRRFILRVVKDLREYNVETVWRKDNEAGVRIVEREERASPAAPIAAPVAKRTSLAELRALVKSV